jgi:hypothetical protein
MRLRVACTVQEQAVNRKIGDRVSLKDLFAFFVLLFIFGGLVYYSPNTLGHPVNYIGRQLCVLFCFGEHPYASLLVDSLDKAESLPIWLVYTVLFITILFSLVGSFTPFNSFFRIKTSLTVPVRRIITAGDCSHFKTSTITMSLKINSWILSKHYVKERKLVYVFSSRSFSSEHRSERTVATVSGKKTKFYLFYEFLALPKSASQVSQAEYLYAKKLWDLFKKKINKASIKIQRAFSLQNLQAMLINLSYVLNVQINQGYNKNNLFTLLSDPCYVRSE